MLLSLAEAVTPLLRARQERVRSGQAILRDGFDEEEAAETTLQLVFFDGEEAFHDWSATDSIYGARWVWFGRSRVAHRFDVLIRGPCLWSFQLPSGEPCNGPVALPPLSVRGI
jgi:hypothetical protein